MKQSTARLPGAMLSALMAPPWMAGLRALVRPPRAAKAQPGSTLLARAPAPRHGHWRIRCAPQDGSNPVRVVRVLALEVEQLSLLTWCEWSNRLLRMPLAAIETAADLETGLAVDLNAWWASRTGALAG